jgi:hypothetical protein
VCVCVREIKREWCVCIMEQGVTYVRMIKRKGIWVNVAYKKEREKERKWNKKKKMQRGKHKWTESELACMVWFYVCEKERKKERKKKHVVFGT